MAWFERSLARTQEKRSLQLNQFSKTKRLLACGQCALSINECILLCDLLAFAAAPARCSRRSFC